MDFDNWASRTIETGTQEQFGYLPVFHFLLYLIYFKKSNDNESKSGSFATYCEQMLVHKAAVQVHREHRAG